MCCFIFNNIDDQAVKYLFHFYTKMYLIMLWDDTKRETRNNSKGKMISKNYIKQHLLLKHFNSASVALNKTKHYKMQFCIFVQ